MKKFSFLFNFQTALILLVSFASSWVSLRFQLRTYFDFLILSLVIAFPLTFLLRESFRRRERAIQYLSLFKASMQSTYDGFENSKLDDVKKLEIKSHLSRISDLLMKFLIQKSVDRSGIEREANAVFKFVNVNKDVLPKRLPIRLTFFYTRAYESIQYLMAVKTHHTPFRIRFTILLTIYMFVAFYPSSLLNKLNYDVTPWYLFLMTAGKGLVLISLYNVQTFLEDPFNQNGPDDIRLDDFRFVA